MLTVDDRKPIKTDWPALLGPKKLKQRHEFIAYLMSFGLTAREISKRVGMTDGYLSQIMNTPIVKERAESLRRELFGMDPNKGMHTMVKQCLSVIDEVLNNPNEKSALKVDAAFRVLERTHGKPRQIVEVEGSLLKDLFARLDSAPQSLDSDATEAEFTPIDQWLAENYSGGTDDEEEGTSGDFCESDAETEGTSDGISERPEDAPLLDPDEG